MGKRAGHDPGGRRRPLPVLALAALAALAGLAVWLWLASRPLSAPPAGEALARAAGGLDEITIAAAFEPETRTLRVTQRFTLVNRGDAPRDTAVFRAYPNAFQREETSPVATVEYYDACYPDGFSGGALSVSAVMTGLSDEPLSGVRHRYLDEAKTALQLTLPAPWEPGASLTAAFQYTVYVPVSAGRFGVQSGIWALGNAFLIPAPFEDGAYRTDPYYSVGDPFVSDCANYTVTVDVPEGYVCAGSAWPEVSDAGNGLRRYRFQALAARDFALCLSRDYRRVQALEEGVLVTVYARSAGEAGQALRYARQALQCFSRRYGAYPYPALTLAEVDFPFEGMEYPGLVMLGSQGLEKGGEELEWLVAHETAHQWWYAAVGSDSVEQAWQDEALCEFAVLDYAETYYGRAARETLWFSRVETAMRVTVPRGVTPGSPLSYFSGMGEYSLVVYRRGAAMLCALDEALGGRLDEFLRTYYDDYRFARASRSDFERALRAFSGEDWTPLIVDYLDTQLSP